MADLGRNIAGHGRIILLNGVPRSGKTSIARAFQELDSRCWLHIGVDWHMSTLPEKLKPGIGLRPGGERPDLELDVAALYTALFDTIAAHARAGFNVIADLGIHDGYSRPLGIWHICSARLSGLNVLIVGVRCGVEEIMRRRMASGSGYAGRLPDGSVPATVTEWERAVHHGHVYDLDLETDRMSPEECAERIAQALSELEPKALRILGMQQP